MESLSHIGSIQEICQNQCPRKICPRKICPRKIFLGKPNTLLLVYGAGKGQPGSPKQFLEDFVLVLSSCQLFLPFPCWYMSLLDGRGCERGLSRSCDFACGFWVGESHILMAENIAQIMRKDGNER